MLRLARIVLTIGKWGNWIIGIPLSIILIILPFIARPQLGAEYQKVIDQAEVVFLVVGLLVLLIMPVVHVVFTRLMRIIDSIPSGEAFSLANAKNLREAAWALLAIDCIDLVYGIFAYHNDITYRTQVHGMSHISGGWSPTFIGWFAALMLFVLAEVWRQGAAMRQDLEGTV